MKIYIVRANADMTKGKGPMVLVGAYLSLDKALDYVNTQTGVMGSKRKYKFSTGMPYRVFTSDGVKLIGTTVADINDHDIIEMEAN